MVEGVRSCEVVLVAIPFDPGQVSTVRVRAYGLGEVSVAIPFDPGQVSTNSLLFFTK
jgi:hypothetical protein